MFGTEDEYPVGHPKGKFWQLCWKIAKNQLLNMLQETYFI